MTLTTLLLAALPAAAAPPTTPDLLAIKVGKAETIDQGTLEHAVILIEDGKIVEHWDLNEAVPEKTVNAVKF